VNDAASLLAEAEAGSALARPVLRGQDEAFGRIHQRSTEPMQRPSRNGATESRKGRGRDMLSKVPLSLENLTTEDVDKEILRAAMIAELDAINLYEQMAALTKNAELRTILLDVAKEEKTHIGEFQALLLAADKEQEIELKKGKVEVTASASK
jgi:hypothetical protein